MSEFLHNPEQRPDQDNTPDGEDLVEQDIPLEQDGLVGQNSQAQQPEARFNLMDIMRRRTFSTHPSPEQKALDIYTERRLHEPTEAELREEELYELIEVRSILKKKYWINDLTWQEVRTLREKIRDNMEILRHRKIKQNELWGKISEAHTSGVDQETLKGLERQKDEIETSGYFVSENAAASFVAGLMHIGMSDIPLESRVEDMTTGEIFQFPYPHYAIRSRDDFNRSKREEAEANDRVWEKVYKLKAVGHEVDLQNSVPTMEFIGKVHKARHPYD